MIKRLAHYRHTPGIRKLFFGIAFLFGIFLATFKFINAETIPFEDQLTGMFPWMDTGYYSNTYFHFGGNNFVGIIFRQTGETLSTPQLITINSGAQAIQCSEKLRGIYYNNQRGRRIWPLDTGNLAILSGYGSGYETMTMGSKGFFTNCTHISGSYYPQSNQVFGEIDHTLNGIDYHMFAGIDYDFLNNAFLSGTNFSGTLSIATGGIHQGYLFDTNGGIAELSMNLPRCGGFSVAPTSFPAGSTGTFICQGNSIAGYILTIFSGGIQQMYTDMVGTTGSTQMRLTGQFLPAGNYTAECVIIMTGTSGIPCGSNTPFQVTSTGIVSSGTSCDPNFQGEITFSAATTGQTVINPSLGTYYTNSTGIIIQRAATAPNTTLISGDFTAQPIVSHYTGTNIFTDIVMQPISLITTNGRNTFSSIYTLTGLSGACTYTDANKRVYVDTLAPTIPVINSPVNGAALCPSTPMSISRSGSYDSGSQVSHYAYQISTNSGMATGIVLSGTVPNTITSANLDISLLPIGTYYLNIIATDNVGLTSASTPVSFTTSSHYCAAGSGIVIVTPTIRLRNVDLDTVYRSDPILVLGLTGSTLVSIDKGMLFINDSTDGDGTTGMITSDDTIYIELVSSDEYDTTVTSELSVAGLTGTFSLTTKTNECSLSSAEKLIIENIYEDLKDEYNNDMSKFSEFINTFQNMVEDESELSSSCTLDYLLELINDDFDTEGIDTSDHITPNCKEYSIAYDSDEGAYYSPDMMTRYYFINRESLIRHLDYYNPGDCHINTYEDNTWSTDDLDSMTHVAPNGKIYHLVEQYGGYSAEEFVTAKYFDSLQNIVTYIDIKNPAKTIRKHTIDTSFLPIVYAAPNGKEYKIYKTDRGYMSYKLLKVQYFSTLSEIKNYIDKNNPSTR